MSKIKSENFINIQGWMVNDLKLKGNKLFIYAIINGFTQGVEGQTFNGSLEYLADWTNSTRQGVLKALKELEKEGLVIAIRDSKCSRKVVRYYTTKFNSTIKQSLTEPIKQSLTNNIVINNNDNNTPYSPPKGDVPSKEEKEQAFNQFYSNYPRKVGKQRALRAWLKLTPEQMQACIDVVRTPEFIRSMEEKNTRKGDFRQHPSSWLNAGSWEDDLSEHKHMFDAMIDGDPF